MLSWKYELTGDEVKYLLKVLNLVPITGEAQASSLLQMALKLRRPLNAEELEKEKAEQKTEKTSE